MVAIDKTQSQTYNLLIENKSIEDIKNQENIKVKEKRRHRGKTIKFFNKINREPLWIVENDNLSENEIETQTKSIEEKSDVNLIKYSYNAITIYDEKQSKKTGIDKIHEEILPIRDKIFFITTFVHINQSISEEIMYFHHFKNGDNEVIKQLKQYENINKYKDDLFLIESNSNHEKNIKIEPVSIKDFLKLQHEFKLKPTKTDWKIWVIIFGITLLLLVVAPICTFVIPALIPATATALLLETKIIIAISFAVGGLIFKGVSSIFENSTKNVQSWMKQKFHLWIRKIPFVNKRNFRKTKAELEIKNNSQKTTENLTSDKLETKLQTQYDILKQELDNRKENNADELISNNTTNHNSNSILENSSIKSENNYNFDSSIKNTVNNQDLQSTTISANTWNKVKCLLT